MPNHLFIHENIYLQFARTVSFERKTSFDTTEGGMQAMGTQRFQEYCLQLSIVIY